MKTRKVAIALPIIIAATTLGVISLAENTTRALRPSSLSDSVSPAGYPGIKYNAQLGMLVFDSAETFRRTVARLSGEIAKFEYDKGRTNDLLIAIRDPKRKDDIYNLLQADSPLSEDVIMAFLRGDFPPERVKDILLRNIDFGEKVDAIYQKISLPPDIRKQIDGQRFNHVPYNPVLDDFEKLFPGFTSLRKTTDRSELKFLLTGADPANPGNPGNKMLFSRTAATLFNSKQEIKVGNAIGVTLPHREIVIKNGNVNILNYIRTHGDIPRNAVPTNEPDNGFPLSSAPALIDPNINIYPTDIANRPNGCGVEVTPTNQTGKLSFNPKIEGTGITYYWNFGDGFVSNDLHKFKHTLQSRHIVIGGTSEISAEVVTYKKTAGVWFGSFNSSSVDLSGMAFTPDINNDLCGNSVVVNQSSGTSHTHIWHTVSQSFGTPEVYLKRQSVSSNGSAFGINNMLQISDCD
jgi:hypothetical protein